ncbi:luteolysis [Branchiostoma belcheri]|nr:luteolysis [Branchiostoma belcheri]
MAEMSRNDLYLEISRNLLDRQGRDLRNYISSTKLLPARDLQHMDPQEIFTALEQEGRLQVGDLSLLVDLMTKIGRVDFANKAKRIAAQETKALKMQKKSDRASDSSDDTFRASPAKRPRVRQPPGQSAKQTTVDVSEHFDTVIKGVSNKWDDLAEALGFTDNEIKGLRHDQYLHNQDKKCREVLHKWKNKHGRRATLQVLYDALINIEEEETAEKLEGGAGPSSIYLDEESSGGSTADRLTPRHQERSAEPGAGGDSESLQTDEGDGKIDVKVEKCDDDFWDKTRNEKPYRMDSRPRGYALILNNKNFTNLPYRGGAGVDLSNITALLKGLSFEIFETDVLEDKTAKQEIEDGVRAFSQRKEHRRVDSCVVVLMSHGDEGVIYGTDDIPVQLDDIFGMFDNKNCPSLMEKPKMFFIQACRGPNIYKGEDQADRAAAEGDLDVKIDLKSELKSLLFPDEADGPGGTSTSTRADMFCGYATQLGYQAIRNTENGSWFIQDITKVFMKNAKNTSLIDMMKMPAPSPAPLPPPSSRAVIAAPSPKIFIGTRHPSVKKDMSKRKASFGGKQEADFLSTLQKPLYFFPDED